jgi:phage major head subunit gpT-like protein
MPLIKEGWAEALEPGIREWFALGYSRRPSLISTLFNVLPSAKDSEYFHSFGAISPDAWLNFEKSGQVSAVSYDAGYKTTFMHKEFLVELPIRRTLLEDNLYSNIIEPVQQLGDSAALRREIDAASVFNNASSTSYLGGDGVPLVDGSHPNGPSKSSTQDNEGSYSLTADNVETVRQAMMAYTDDVGEMLGVMPNLLLVPPELENQAKIITQTEYSVGNANNDVNPQMGRFQYLVWHYLTDSDGWFMIDTNLMRRSLIWFDRVPLSINLKAGDTTVFATYIARMRYSYGWRDWRWIYGNNIT